MNKTFKKRQKKIISILILTNIFVIIVSLIFFDYYKKRKLDHYNTLFNNKQLEIDNIEKYLSPYYHNFNDLVFYLSDEKKINTQQNQYLYKRIKTNLYFAKSTGKSTAYLELFDNNLILVTATGLFFSIKEDQLLNTKIKPKKINSNINDFFFNDKFYLRSNYGLKDVLIDRNNIYVTYNNEVKKNCFNTGILKAEYNSNYLNFKKFFNHHECKSNLNSKYGTFSVNQAGGRLIKFKENYLLSHGSYSEFDEVQSSKSIFGKILKISKNGNLIKIYSKGHRNPQGLNKYSEDIILQTEHGPDGGDEINILEEDRNYGWPLASYGSHYKGQKFIDKYYPLPKKHGSFTEPVKFFKNSIAISQIITVPKKFDNSKSKSIYLASMKKNENYGNQINLYKFKYENEILMMKDTIPIGERIRDIIYNKKNNELIMFLDTSASIAFLKIENLN